MRRGWRLSRLLWLFPLWAPLQIIVFLSAEPGGHPKEHVSEAPDSGLLALQAVGLMSQHCGAGHPGEPAFRVDQSGDRGWARCCRYPLDPPDAPVSRPCGWRTFCCPQPPRAPMGVCRGV